MINILYCYDAGYFYQTMVSINSLLMHTSEAITIHIITDDNDNLQDQEINKIIENKNCNVKKNVIPDNQFIGLRNNLHLTKGAYYRLAAPEVLSDLEHIIYLDSDTIIEADIRNLEILYDQKYWIQGVDEENPIQVNRVGLSDDLYLNSGILLMNLKSLREHKFYQNSLVWISQNPDKTFFADQDVINVLSDGKKGRIPVNWNLNPIPFDTLDVLFLHPKRILHFGGPLKPWNICYDFSLQKLYDDYSRRIGDQLICNKLEPKTSGQNFIVANQFFSEENYKRSAQYYYRGLDYFLTHSTNVDTSLIKYVDFGLDLMENKLYFHACGLFRVLLIENGFLIDHSINLYKMKDLF